MRNESLFDLTAGISDRFIEEAKPKKALQQSAAPDISVTQSAALPGQKRSRIIQWITTGMTAAAAVGLIVGGSFLMKKISRQAPGDSGISSETEIIPVQQTNWLGGTGTIKAAFHQGNLPDSTSEQNALMLADDNSCYLITESRGEGSLIFHTLRNADNGQYQHDEALCADFSARYQNLLGNAKILCSKDDALVFADSEGKISAVSPDGTVITLFQYPNADESLLTGTENGFAVKALVPVNDTIWFTAAENNYGTTMFWYDTASETVTYLDETSFPDPDTVLSTLHFETDADGTAIYATDINECFLIRIPVPGSSASPEKIQIMDYTDYQSAGMWHVQDGICYFVGQTAALTAAETDGSSKIALAETEGLILTAFGHADGRIYFTDQESAVVSCYDPESKKCSTVCEIGFPLPETTAGAGISVLPVSAQCICVLDSHGHCVLTVDGRIHTFNLLHADEPQYSDDAVIAPVSAVPFDSALGLSRTDKGFWFSGNQLAAYTGDDSQAYSKFVRTKDYPINDPYEYVNGYHIVSQQTLMKDEREVFSVPDDVIAKTGGLQVANILFAVQVSEEYVLIGMVGSGNEQGYSYLLWHNLKSDDIREVHQEVGELYSLQVQPDPQNTGAYLYQSADDLIFRISPDSNTAAQWTLPLNHSVTDCRWTPYQDDIIYLDQDGSLSFLSTDSKTNTPFLQDTAHAVTQCGGTLYAISRNQKTVSAYDEASSAWTTLASIQTDSDEKFDSFAGIWDDVIVLRTANSLSVTNFAAVRRDGSGMQLLVLPPYNG